ncbi:hypothetical protein EJB05_09255, partial [Eragrostis curvula]
MQKAGLESWSASISFVGSYIRHHRHHVVACAAGAGGVQPTRAASAVVAKPARGFQVFRIDGFSWTKALPGGKRISSEPFTVGGLVWVVDYYPNGTDASKLDSDYVSLYLRLVDGGDSYMADADHGGRVRAQFKFGLLDVAGTAAQTVSGAGLSASPLGPPH